VKQEANTGGGFQNPQPMGFVRQGLFSQVRHDLW